MTRKCLTLLTVLFFVLSGQLWAAGSKKKEDTGDKAHAHYNRGIDLTAEGDFAGARAEFEKALEIKEEFAEAHNNLGYVLRRQGPDNFDAALNHYNRALELNSKLAEAYMYRGVLHTLAGDEAAAKKDHEALAGIDREMADQLMQVIASGEEPAGTAGLAAKWE